MAKPVKIVASGGFPVTDVSGIDGAVPATPVEDPLPGFPITLVASGGYPMNLINEDGTDWIAP